MFDMIVSFFVTLLILFLIWQRFYRTLSELKSEVESVIKTGRKMVEEKQVQDPPAFSKKIDMLKELYNKLGAQITEAKHMLENALIISREIQTDLLSLNKWLDSLVGDEGKKTWELEMPKMETIKDKLNSNYVEFSKNCEAIYLEPLKEAIDQTNERWELLKKYGVPETEGKIDESVVQLLKDLDDQIKNMHTFSPEKLNEIKGTIDLKKHDDPKVTKKFKAMLDKIEVSHCLINNIYVY